MSLNPGWTTTECFNQKCLPLQVNFLWTFMKHNSFLFTVIQPGCVNTVLYWCCLIMMLLPYCVRTDPCVDNYCIEWTWKQNIWSRVTTLQAILQLKLPIHPMQHNWTIGVFLLDFWKQFMNMIVLYFLNQLCVNTVIHWCCLITHSHHTVCILTHM